MRIDVFTIFPDMVDGVRRPEPARAGPGAAGLLDLRVHDLRDATTDAHRTVDDTPFGGGAGMVLMARADLRHRRGRRPAPPAAPARPGRSHASTRPTPASWPRLDGFSLLCGRYEGVDERVRDHLVDGELSVGDYVLAGGEVAAMVVLEAVGRLVPGVMGNDTSADDESFADGLLEYPQYTRPAEFRGWAVPEVLRSGDHGRVDALAAGPGAAPHASSDRPDLIERPRRARPPTSSACSPSSPPS